MARVDPRVPSNLECDWLEARLDKVGRGRYLNAKTLDQNLVLKEGLLISRNRELLMSASSGGVSTPREFSRLRRLRASLAADKQVAARRRKQLRAAGSQPTSPRRLSTADAKREEERLREEQEARDAEAEQVRAANEAADNLRPEAGVGQVVRIRSNITKPAYGWGNLEGNAMGKVIQVRLVPRPKDREKKEWHYLVELLDSPYHHAVTKPRFWVSQYEIEGRRGHLTAGAVTAEMMAKLIPESQTDWARLDRLATPKSRGGHGDEPNAFLGTGASWSQSSGMMGFEAAAMGSTVSSLASSIADPSCFAYPFAPMTSPRSRKLAKGRRAQLEKMARGNADSAEDGDATATGEGDATGGEASGADTAAGSGGNGGSGGSTPRIRPQTSYGELLYRSSQSALSVGTKGALATDESTGSVTSWDVRSPRANKGSATARAPVAPQLPQLPACSPRLRRTCGVYGLSPGRRPGTTGSKRKERVKAPGYALHERKPVPPVPPGLLEGE